MDSLKWIAFQILRKMKGRKPKRYENSDSEEISFPEESVEYDFITIQNATNNFSETTKIGEGGFGIVYKGTFENGQEVAVKRLSKNLKGGSQEFKNEVALMVKFQHRNLVKLLGFSLEGKEVFLVYEFVPNGSLDNFLYDPVKRECLGWERRYKIIECIARGLVYLHEGSYIRIIHCNLKASNVLLDEDLNPKIVDFDMSKLFTLDKIHNSTSRIMRTRYMAPEYALLGEISIKSDVYSFGMLILEIISGHRISSFQNGESRNDDLLSYAWTHWKDGSTSNVIDSMLKGISCPVHEITKCIHIALLCVQESVADRPKMIEVLHMLNNLSIRLPEPLDPGLFIRGSIISSEASSQFTKNVKSISDQYHRKMQKKAKCYAKNPVKCGYLNWGRRYKIIESIGRGLVYLHEDSRLRIVHRDVTTSNILLDEDLNPKINNFEVAWLFALDESHCEHETVMGTLGYIAPECFSRGELFVKSDVYSFGVLVLEIISGQKCFNFQNEVCVGYLASYAWTHWKNGSSSNVIDPMLRGISSPVDDIIKCIQVALLCVQEKVEDRPTMGEVVQMLSNLSMSLPIPSTPGFFCPVDLTTNTNSESSDDLEGSIYEMSISDDDEYLR